MKDQFYLHFETMPKATAQHKGVSFRNGKPHFYEKSNIENVRHLFTFALKEHKPARPSEKPIKLTLWFAFDTKNKKLWGKDAEEGQEPWTNREYKATRPDVDNIAKLFIDCMNGLYFKDDAQICELRLIKTYAERATIAVSWEEIPTASDKARLAKKAEDEAYREAYRDAMKLDENEDSAAYKWRM